MKTEQDSFRYKAIKASEFPKDVVLGQPIVEILGQSELRIENYRGIIEYTDQMVRVQTKSGQIRITGQCLNVEYYTCTDMKVTGKIESVDYPK